MTAFDQLVAESADRAPDRQQITIPAGTRLGDLVIKTEHLRKEFDDRMLIDDLSLKIPPGAIIGVIGPNGAGKTTFCHMVTGQEAPDDGTLRIGDTVVLGYVDQSRDALGDDKNVWEEISGGLDVIELGKRTVQSRAYVAGFNFRGPINKKRSGNYEACEGDYKCRRGADADQPHRIK